jgi:plasmid stability protein
MATLTIRQVDDAAHEGLRVYAAKQGKSVEEVMREVIVEQFAPTKKPDLRPLQALREKFKKSEALDGLTAAEAVRQMRNEDIAATEAKWARIETDWAAARKKKPTE